MRSIEERIQGCVADLVEAWPKVLPSSFEFYLRRWFDVPVDAIGTVYENGSPSDAVGDVEIEKGTE